MDVAELLARESVRDLVARYNANADTGRFDEAVALFAPDAVLDLDGNAHHGRDAIRAVFVGARDGRSDQAGDGPRYVRHHTSTLQIDVLGATTARARCYYQVIIDKGLDHWGRYMDEYAVIDGRWLFTARREKLDGYLPGGWLDHMNQSRGLNL